MVPSIIQCEEMQLAIILTVAAVRNEGRQLVIIIVVVVFKAWRRVRQQHMPGRRAGEIRRQVLRHFSPGRSGGGRPPPTPSTSG